MKRRKSKTCRSISSLRRLFTRGGRLRFEPLEDRDLLATLTVNSALDMQLGGLAQQFAAGEFTSLRENIHKPARCYSAAELVERVTGQPLSHKPLIAYLREKLTPLYELS